MTKEKALNYAMNTSFCNGCPVDMSRSDGKECDSCDHRQFFTMAIEALQKQVPEKPYNWQGEEVKLRDLNHPNCCPSCNYDFVWSTDMYCPKCGQRLLWR